MVHGLASKASTLYVRVSQFKSSSVYQSVIHNKSHVQHHWRLWLGSKFKYLNLMFHNVFNLVLHDTMITCSILLRMINISLLCCVLISGKKTWNLHCLGSAFWSSIIHFCLVKRKLMFYLSAKYLPTQKTII